MFSWFVPHLRIAHPLELNLARVRELGLDALLLDVDNTLEPWPVEDFSAETRDWLRSLRQGGIQLCLVSNGLGPRIAGLAHRYALPCVLRAYKPLPGGCRRALRELGLDPSRTGVMGDQIFADVMAGRLAGVFTILVSPRSTNEPWFTRIKRPFERLVLSFLGPP